VHWLGFDWGKNLFYASDYFERLYDWAEGLIKVGLAYVDDQSQEEIRVARGTLTEPGKNSPFRERPVDENLDLFRRMRKGEFQNGARVLRAKIDMSAGNINLRDPVLYRILHAHHPRTGDKWCIYPSYDYAHGSLMRSRASRIRSAPWNSRIIGRSTTGCSTRSWCPRSRTSMSSRGST
jgi:glutaminyl-tRNA synthetase